MKKSIRVVQGNEAALEGALLAGCRFFAGYPITPATEIAELAALRMPQVGGTFMQMEDEIASIHLLVSASWCGRKVMSATSGPGFVLMQEGLSYAYISQAPCVILNVQRGGPSTGQATRSSQQDVMETRYGFNGEYEPVVLAPSSAQECLDFTARAFYLSEKYLTPVIVLMDEVVGHTREQVLFHESIPTYERRRPPEGHPYRQFEPIPELGGVPYRLSIGEGANVVIESTLNNLDGVNCSQNSEKAADCLDRLLGKIRNNAQEIIDVSMEYIDGAEYILIGWGSTARVAMRAASMARAEGHKVGFMKLNTVWPFPDKILHEVLTRSAKDVVFAMPEMNSGKLCHEVERATGHRVHSFPKLGGDLHTPAEILKELLG